LIKYLNSVTFGALMRVMKRRHFLFAALCVPQHAWANTVYAAKKLVEAATSQIGVTTLYDPTYVKLAYPNGDVPMDRGVCTDVVIRAYRQGLGIDLQQLVHVDMNRNFASYPKTWGLSKTDPSIDHRRVPNLQRFFKRQNAEIALSDDYSSFNAGDLVTMMLPGNLPHIAIVSAILNEVGNKPLIIHNIGGGAALEDVLGLYRVTGRYRYFPGSSDS
jgi:uncharacterized protein